MAHHSKRLILAALLLMSGCAALPPCENFAAYVATDNAGNPLFVLDQDNARKLGALMIGLSERTCGLPK